MRNSKASVSINQLASMLDLSPGTVSFVLNGRGDEMRISKSTQERVLETAREHGLQPKIRTRRLMKAGDKNQRYLITVMSPYLKGVKNVLGSIIYGLQEVILEEKLPVEIIIHPYYYGRICDCKKQLSSSYSDGAIISGLSDDDVQFLMERDFDIPIVLFNRSTEKYSSAYIDDYEAGNKVASILYKKGHKNVGLITPNFKSKASSLRQLGFLDGCRNFGINIEPCHIQEDELSNDGGYLAAARLLEHKDLPSALFIMIDNMVPGAVKALTEKNVKIPGDMEIITYGDNKYNEYILPPLLSIHMPVESIIKECLHILLDMVNSKDRHPISRILPLTVFPQGSCPKE